jgi:hypothetical protein
LTFPGEEPRAFRNWPKHSIACEFYQPIEKCTCHIVDNIPGVIQTIGGMDDCPVHGFPGKYPKEYEEIETIVKDL